MSSPLLADSFRSWIIADDWRAADLLPGLYVALLGLLLAVALRRLYDPVPHRIWWSHAVLIAFVFAPALAGGKVQLPTEILRAAPPFRHLPASEPGGHSLHTDLVAEITPHQARARHAFGRGEWPLWNDFVGAGMPLLADPQAQALQPLVLVAAPFSLFQAPAITGSLRVLLALTFSFLLFRRLGLGEGAALYGSLAYGLSGCVQLWLGWPLANAPALLPALLYAVVRAWQQGARRDFALLIATGAAVLLGGQPDSVLYALSTAALFLFALAWGARSQAALWRRIGKVTAALALAAALAAPALLPAREYLPKTQRAAVVRAVFGSRSPAAALAELRIPAALRAWRERVRQRATALVAPYALSQSGGYRGETNPIEDGAGFAGTATLALAALSLVGRPPRTGERFFRGLLAGCVVLLCLPPLFSTFTYRLPLVGFTAAHQHRRVMMLVALCLSFLAAAALDRWGDSEVERMRRSARWLLPVIALVTAAELLARHLPYNVPNSRRLAFPETQGIRFLRENLGESRMVGMRRVFRPNFPSLYGLSDVRISNAAEPAAYARYTAPVRTERDPQLFVKPLDATYQRLGVRYVVTAPGTDLPLPAVYRGSDLVIFERSSPRRRIFLPAAARPTDAATGEVKGMELRSCHLRADLTLAVTQPVVANVYQDGSWQVLLNGRPAPHELAEGLFAAAPATAGRHRVDFVYRPRAFVLGLGLAAIGFAAALVWFVPAPKTRKVG